MLYNNGLWGLFYKTSWTQNLQQMNRFRIFAYSSGALLGVPLYGRAPCLTRKSVKKTETNTIAYSAVTFMMKQNIFFKQ
jgi:hypothetical protein